MRRFFRELRPGRAGIPWIGFAALCSLSMLFLLLVVENRDSEALGRRRASDERVAKAQTWSRQRPRNVILMIGDGMGLAQLTLARYQKGQLAMQRMPIAGYSYTQSLRDFVTDSAAGATALASGERVVNGVVGQRPDGTPTRTVLELAEARGLATGLVATSRITHATPAAMVTHVGSRNEEKKIAAQLAASKVEVLLGGGWDMFRGSGMRADGSDLILEMKRRGYVFVHTAGELALASSQGATKLLGLFSPGPMPKRAAGRSPSLEAMAIAALRVLNRSPRGFFLMIEGSQIDWGGHENDPDYVMHETADFDDTLDAVLRFLNEAGIEDETLVLVTSDHETGGLALNMNPQLRLGIEPRWTTQGHTGVPVPVFARGPGALGFSGIQDHASIGRELKRLVGSSE